MKITSIKQQVKRADAYSIFLDGKYSFSLSGSELLKSGLAPNQDVSVEQLEVLQIQPR